ncbi:DUF7266 family protein [Halorarius halobius]|uniref:DUF7266 family protein n=1 Tax=Halorarius halobius TaxID=2962671 RepID=UPI0020CE99E7|nr:hypothetical protein [Halorarius halobius]
MTSDRGVSTVVGYVVTLGVTSLLVTGLLIAAGGYVQDQREATVREELKVIGQRLSGDVSAADRIGHVGAPSDVRVRRTLPTETAGTTYSIRLTDSGGAARLVLSADSPSVEVTVPVALSEDTVVADSGAGAGDIVVSFDPGSPNEVTIANG